MRLLSSASCWILLSGTSALAESILTKSNLTDPPSSSSQILPSTFKPPQVFTNNNLVRSINLEKSYPREQVTLVVENTSKEPQDQYYLPFPADVIGRVGGFEVRNKNDAEAEKFETRLVEYDPYSPTQYQLITLPTPLAPSKPLTLTLTWHVLSALTPLPAASEQTAKQYLVYRFSTYLSSSYTTLKQKTKLKLSSPEIPDYTVLDGTSNSENTEDPVRQGTSLTYGAFGRVEAGATQDVYVRYEYTNPLAYVTSLERDIEVSHWGNNLATEERYVLTNSGTHLSTPFNRVAWAGAQYYNPATFALKDLKLPLRIGSSNPYFTDDIGNVSTSRFRSSRKEAHLELKPRYPVFGGWWYKFRVGWDNDLTTSVLRRLKSGSGGGSGGGERYILKVPFLEGPKSPEGISYASVHLRVILPEGARAIHFHTSVPFVSSSTGLHKTFMDTVGRPTVELRAVNLVDDARGAGDLYVTYEYSRLSALRKPLTIVGTVFAVFVAAWVIGTVDVSIGRKT